MKMRNPKIHRLRFPSQTYGITRNNVKKTNEEYHTDFCPLRFAAILSMGDIQRLRIYLHATLHHAYLEIRLFFLYNAAYQTVQLIVSVGIIIMLKYDLKSQRQVDFC